MGIPRKVQMERKVDRSRKTVSVSLNVTRVHKCIRIFLLIEMNVILHNDENENKSQRSQQQN